MHKVNKTFTVKLCKSKLKAEISSFLKENSFDKYYKQPRSTTKFRDFYISWGFISVRRKSLHGLVELEKFWLSTNSGSLTQYTIEYQNKNTINLKYQTNRYFNKIKNKILKYILKNIFLK